MLKLTLPIMLLGLALSGTVDAAPRSYGPVKDQDTLWTIADRLRPDNRATVQQTMLALYYKNPQAFASNNINSLMKGTVLKAPSSAEARRYQRLAALREARKHNHFWKRGVDLPRTEAPPVPKLKERTATKRSKPTGLKARPKTGTYTATPRNTTLRLARLQAQLQAAEAKNQELTRALKSLQAKQSQGKPNPQLDAQVQKLKLELQELTSVLDQKDNHIKTLQASLKNASETIKAQHADNMRLYDKLKEVSPASVPTPSSSVGKSELKLTTVETATAAITGVAAANATPEDNQDATASKLEAANSTTKETVTKLVWADEQQASTTTTTAEPKSSSETTSPPPSTEPQTLAATVPSTLPSTDSSVEKPAKETATSDSKISTDTTKPSESLEKTPQAAAPETENKTAEAKNNPATTANDATSQSPVTANSKPSSDITASNSAQGAAHLTPTNDVKTTSSVPVSQMLTQSNSQNSTGTNTTPSAPTRGVSPLALAVALISLLFILAMVWRAFVQQREMQRLEEEEARVAERMRWRLEENQSSSVSTHTATVVETKAPELDSKPDVKF